LLCEKSRITGCDVGAPKFQRMIEAGTSKPALFDECHFIEEVRFWP
jgi:hypothetical protein